ncbi:hypothetical protein NMY22_g16622 [Coprinellus aureogranulatus]|nr:hypothetical protein NMY22_g16622 [Coprinellus aureogranulatus]
MSHPLHGVGKKPSIPPAKNLRVYLFRFTQACDGVIRLQVAEVFVSVSPTSLATMPIAGTVSHDFKGGYVENPFSKSYTFNWWSSADTFNYFSHHRITIPPPEWITAAHRAGVAMHGTLIFEGGGEIDMLRMIMGRIPGINATEARTQANPTIPLSPYYAELLADVAKERGFDGYLLNIEIGLGRGAEEARALASWITILQNELVKKVGPHAQTIWYDSVTIRGELWWQDRLDSANLPFFLESSGIFTNYWWYNDVPPKQVSYFARIDPQLTGQTVEVQPHIVRKSVQDIYMGVDVWGRGSHGGGGFGLYRALDHVSPLNLGLSVALFAQGWTWENEENNPGWNWAQFWDTDSRLWVGPASGNVTVPPLDIKGGETPCTHGPFTPITNYFLHLPPPEPYDLPFYTSFNPGIGDSWFVEGRKVWQSVRGWTDMDKQTLVGDLIWPRPKVTRLDGRPDAAPIGLTRFNFADAWNGGNSVNITLSIPGSNNAYNALWVPIQTLNLHSRRKYEATAIYKAPTTANVDTEFALGLRSASGQDLMTITSSSTIDLANGWQKAVVQFEISGPAAGSVLTQGQLGRSEGSFLWALSRYTNLDGGDTTESPEVTVGDPRELLLDLLHQVASDVETSVGTVKGLGFESHGSIVAGAHSQDGTELISQRCTNLPPVLDSLSYVPDECQASRRRTGP